MEGAVMEMMIGTVTPCHERTHMAQELLCAFVEHLSVWSCDKRCSIKINVMVPLGAAHTAIIRSASAEGSGPWPSARTAYR